MVYFVHFVIRCVRVSSRFGRVSRPAKIEKEPGVPVGLFFLARQSINTTLKKSRSNLSLSDSPPLGYPYLSTKKPVCTDPFLALEQRLEKRFAIPCSGQHRDHRRHLSIGTMDFGSDPSPTGS